MSEPMTNTEIALFGLILATFALPKWTHFSEMPGRRDTSSAGNHASPFTNWFEKWPQQICEQLNATSLSRVRDTMSWGITNDGPISQDLRCRSYGPGRLRNNGTTARAGI